MKTDSKMNHMTKVTRASRTDPENSAFGSPITTDNNCLQVSWLGENGIWIFYSAAVVSADNDRLIIKYDYAHGTLDLRVKSEAGTSDLLYTGRWSENRGRAGGAVSLELPEGKQVATGCVHLS